MCVMGVRMCAIRMYVMVQGRFEGYMLVWEVVWKIFGAQCKDCKATAYTLGTMLYNSKEVHITVL